MSRKTEEDLRGSCGGPKGDFRAPPVDLKRNRRDLEAHERESTNDDLPQRGHQKGSTEESLLRRVRRRSFSKEVSRERVYQECPPTPAKIRNISYFCFELDAIEICEATMSIRNFGVSNENVHFRHHSALRNFAYPN